MRIIALSTIKRAWHGKSHFDDLREAAQAWFRHAVRADWASPGDVKADFGNASILNEGRAVFNLAGNKVRLIVKINYPYRVVYIRFIGTHAQYDRVDAQVI